MDKVEAGQLRLVPIDIRQGSEWIKAGTPYLVIGQQEGDDISWRCLLGNTTVSWHVEDVKRDKLVVQD